MGGPKVYYLLPFPVGPRSENIEKMSALKTFRIKRKLAKKLKQNRPIPQWFRSGRATPSATTPRGATGGGPSSSCKPRSSMESFGDPAVHKMAARRQIQLE